MRLIDSHCHLDFPDFDADREEVLRSASQAGVKCLVIPGVKAATWNGLLEICRTHSGLYPALGLHPYFIEDHRDCHVEQLRDLLARHEAEVIAVGEIGVDARKPDFERQWELFRMQLDLAHEVDKPVIIHSVKTHDEVYAELKRRELPGRGVIHAFSGSFQQAQHFFDLGYKLGIGGVITYERAHKTREAVRQVPLEALVLESDAPDMAMSGHQNERNSPQWLPEVFSALMAIRDEPADRLAEALWINACKLFNVEFSRSA